MKTAHTLGAVSLCLLPAFATIAIAQAPAAATPASAPKIDAKVPGDCTTRLSDWRNAQLATSVAAVRQAAPDDRDAAVAAYSKVYSVVSAEAMRAAKECAAKFSVDKTPSVQLIDLSDLYGFAGDTANRRRAVERVLAVTDLPPRQHGQALLLAMKAEVTAAGDHFGIIDGAERVATQIDALPDSLADLKLSAHTLMLARYEYLDVDGGLRTHATAVLALGRRLQKPAAMVSAYMSLARASADLLHPDSALMVLDAAEKELGKEKGALSFADFRNRYALIGAKASTITGQWWLNADGEPSPIQPADGKVRLVEFTAHWCGPCKNSYPGVRSLADRFRGQPFEGVMVTSLYGYLGTQRNLNEEQEVAADRVFFTQDHQIPYKIAINAFPKSAKGTPSGQPQVDLDYHVGGIPQIIIIDKRGVIRQIVTGWDAGNTERIGNLIERLLKEPVT